MTFKEFQAFSYLNESSLKLKNRIRMINGLAAAMRRINGVELVGGGYRFVNEHADIDQYLSLPVKQMKNWYQMGPVTIKELKRCYRAFRKDQANLEGQGTPKSVEE